MRKVLPSSWLIFAALLTVSLSAFSFYAVKTPASETPKKECCRRPNVPQGEMPWDAVSRQFISVFSIQ